MQSIMTFGSMAALFGAIAVLALIPSVSVLTVSARSAASGFIHGAFTTIGILVGDIVFILVAVLGLTILAETTGGLLALVKYLGGAYLIWMGIKLWKSVPKSRKVEEVAEPSLLSSFLAGLFITLGDQKAILFYLGFFPAFVDLSAISYFDTSIIIVIVIAAVGSVKLGYAFIANRAGVLFSPTAYQGLNIGAGCVVIGVGVFLVAKP